MLGANHADRKLDGTVQRWTSRWLRDFSSRYFLVVVLVLSMAAGRSCTSESGWNGGVRSKSKISWAWSIKPSKPEICRGDREANVQGPVRMIAQLSSKSTSNPAVVPCCVCRARHPCPYLIAKDKPASLRDCPKLSGTRWDGEGGQEQARWAKIRSSRERRKHQGRRSSH